MKLVYPYCTTDCESYTIIHILIHLSYVLGHLSCILVHLSYILIQLPCILKHLSCITHTPIIHTLIHLSYILIQLPCIPKHLSYYSYTYHTYSHTSIIRTHTPIIHDQTPMIHSHTPIIHTNTFFVTFLNAMFVVLSVCSLPDSASEMIFDFTDQILPQSLTPNSNPDPKRYNGPYARGCINGS